MRGRLAALALTLGLLLTGCAAGERALSLIHIYTGEASILAIIMMIFGVAIMLLNQMSLHSRKN